MASKKDVARSKELPTKEEAENAFEALTEVFEDGFTNRKCLRCGGELIVKENGNSSEVWCKREDRKLLTSRGI